MNESIREQVLATLQNDWASYVERFHRLSPEAQATFLTKQGYTRLADLLAHIIAWWKDGSQIIESMLIDPNVYLQDYDVDAFNAQAVSSVRDLDEVTLIQAFEDMRLGMLKLVMSLPDATFQNKRIVDRLQIEVLGHLAQHAITECKV